MSYSSRQLVVRKATEVFPEVLEEVLEMLDRYDGKERDRVHLAVLKLSRGSLELLEVCVSTAVQDYRDVLAPAEYPREAARSVTELSEMSEEEVQAIREQDRQEYLAWLDEKP